jgi:hypothetical protein
LPNDLSFHFLLAITFLSSPYQFFLVSIFVQLQ